MTNAKTIWKFPLVLTDEQEIEMPAASDILHVDVQHDVLALWALVFPDAPKVKRKIYVFGTGNPYKTEGPVDHIGTVQMAGGALVWHVFALDETWRRS